MNKIQGIACLLLFTSHTLFAQVPTYKVSKVITPRGVIYSHEDAETTHIIEFLSGKSDLSQNELSVALSDMDKYLFRETGIYLFKHERGLQDSRLFTRYSFAEKKFVAGGSTITGDKTTFLVKTKAIESEERYQQIWLMLTQYGNPKVKWRTWSTNTFPAEFRRARYLYKENTIELPILYSNSNLFLIDPAIQYLLAELAHAEQFTKDYAGAEKSFLEGVKRAQEKAGTLEGPAFLSAYNEEYKREGSLEFEAHEHIEPKVRAKYSSLSLLWGIRWVIRIM